MRRLILIVLLLFLLGLGLGLFELELLQFFLVSLGVSLVFIRRHNAEANRSDVRVPQFLVLAEFLAKIFLVYSQLLQQMMREYPILIIHDGVLQFVDQILETFFVH